MIGIQAILAHKLRYGLVLNAPTANINVTAQLVVEVIELILSHNHRQAGSRKPTLIIFNFYKVLVL